MDKQIFLVQRFNLLDILLGLHIEIEITEHLRKSRRNTWVPHFPKSEGAALEELLDPELVVLKVHIRPLSIIRHCLEYSLLDLFVNNILLVPPIQQLPDLLLFSVKAVSDGDSEASV